MKKPIATACLLLACGQAVQAQVISHLTFEDQEAGEQLDTISENGRVWFPFASETALLPIASSEVPPDELRVDTAPATTLSGDFTPGLGYLEADGDALSLPDAGWTIETFVRFEAVGGFQTIFGRDKDILEDRTPNADLYFQKDNTDRFRVAYNHGFEDTDGDGVEESLIRPIATASPVLVAGEWYHLAAVYDGSTDMLSLYVNATLAGEAEVAGNVIPVSNPGSQFWTIGRGSYADAAGDSLNAQLDDFRITGAVLTPDQFLAVAPPPPCAADYDGNGIANVNDLLGFLGAFRQGCPEPGVEETLLADDFDGAGDPLNDAEADVGGTWSANLGWLDNGIVSGVANEGGAFLPFDAEVNHEYRLSLEISNTSAQWIALGFARDPLTSPGAADINDRHSNEPEGIAWMLYRNDPARNDLEIFAGLRTGGNLYGADPGIDFSVPHTLEVFIDTTGDGLSFTADFFLDGVSLLGAPATINIAVADINFAGISWDAPNEGSPDVTVEFDDFTLTGADLAPDCPADFDGNGIANVNDLLGFLGAFRQGCPE